MVKLQSNQHIQELPLNNPKEKEKEDKNMPLSVVNVVIGQEVELSDKEKKYTVNDKPSKDLDSNSKGHKRLSVSSLSKNKVEQLEKDNHNTFDSSGLDPKDISERTPNNQELLEPSKSRFNSMHTTIKRGETRKRSNIFEEGAEIKGRKRRFIDAILRSWTWTLLITILTFYTLFSDDVKVIFFNPTHGLYFDIANYICMAFFVLEIVLQAISDTKNYLFSFYFFLDVISTLTMILDLQYFSESTSGSGIDSLNNIFRSAKTAKLGSRAGRIGRVIRIVGVFRLSKIFKEAEKVKQKKIDKFDKELKKKRQEKEEELRKIKEHLNEIENLK
jgi:hypothetical protein